MNFFFLALTLCFLWLLEEEEGLHFKLHAKQRKSSGSEQHPLRSCLLLSPPRNLKARKNISKPKRNMRSDMCYQGRAQLRCTQSKCLPESSWTPPATPRLYSILHESELQNVVFKTSCLSWVPTNLGVVPLAKTKCLNNDLRAASDD